MALIDVDVSYLEMLAPCKREARPPREGLTVVQAKRPTVAFYRFMYNTVGQEYHWYSRGKRNDAELALILGNPLNELHVLYDNGTPAGFAELDRTVNEEIELVQFGLMREFIGQGLGKYFLQWTVDKAWTYRTQRLWLHTCSLDHPAALPNYLKAGFRLYKEERIQRDVSA
jgi:GNAT superfamily N-acetyltransferase